MVCACVRVCVYACVRVCVCVRQLPRVFCPGGPERARARTPIIPPHPPTSGPPASASVCPYHALRARLQSVFAVDKNPLVVFQVQEMYDWGARVREGRAGGECARGQSAVRRQRHRDIET